MIYYAQIKTVQTGDINYISDNIFFEGCREACLYCFNKELWERKHEMKMSEVLSSLSDISKYVCFMGGEPTEQILLPIIDEIRKSGKKIIIFTAHPERLYGIDHLFHHIHYDLKPTKTPMKVRNNTSYGIVADTQYFDEDYVEQLKFYIEPYRPIYIKEAYGIQYAKEKQETFHKWFEKHGFKNLKMTARITI